MTIFNIFKSICRLQKDKEVYLYEDGIPKQKLNIQIDDNLRKEAVHYVKNKQSKNSDFLKNISSTPNTSNKNENDGEDLKFKELQKTIKNEVRQTVTSEMKELQEKIDQLLKISQNKN